MDCYGVYGRHSNPWLLVPKPELSSSNGTATARNVRVSVSLFNGSGGLVDVASTTAVPQDLEPQQTGDFKITTTTAPDGYASQTFTVEWDG